MACLQVETPPICRGKFKTVLQLCLQQRRTREQLVEQGIMPPLKAPAGFHEQIRSLERARTGTFLKHKLCSRPERSELVRMHILQETQADSSLQAAQLRLKRARLADSLNERSHIGLVLWSWWRRTSYLCHQRTKSLGMALNSDGSSPGSQKSDSSSSSRESGDKEIAQSPSFNCHNQCSPKPQLTADVALSSEKQNYCQTASPPRTALVHSVAPGPVLVKQSLSRATGEKSRSKKSREPKPRVKKLKYHQYIPPHQKQEQDVPMDSAYARLLQQQQQFLHLQILSQQQFSYSSAQPASLKQTSEVQSSCCGANGASLNYLQNPTRPELPTNLEDMKVAELKTELKLRSLPVSGTKIDLIERLRLYHENRMDVLSPPVSPIASKVSKLGLKDIVPSEALDCPAESPEEGDKDKRLFEKERQIKELMMKLEQEQRLVEELKMQLEVEKRFQQGDSPPPASCPALIQVKEELVTPSNCSSMCPVPPAEVKQEVTQLSIANSVLMSMNLLNPETSPPRPNATQGSAQLQQQDTAQKAWTDAAVLGSFSCDGHLQTRDSTVCQTRASQPGAASPSHRQCDHSAHQHSVMSPSGCGPSGTAPVPSTLKQTDALHSPLSCVHMEFEENTSDSHIPGEDSMDWLDLTDMSAHVGIFSSDFLDSNEMHLNWE
ncbi:hypothetical protein WMY93_003837 [Mugilogobius chulae]|uniref:SAP domain-containing protein n=1 Tax=Mugilogobius chulae TaxID=88201 RepID=A0AAW0PXT7_9GOBI